MFDNGEILDLVLNFETSLDLVLNDTNDNSYTVLRKVDITNEHVDFTLKRFKYVKFQDTIIFRFDETWNHKLQNPMAFLGYLAKFKHWRNPERGTYIDIANIFDLSNYTSRSDYRYFIITTNYHPRPDIGFEVGIKLYVYNDQDNQFYFNIYIEACEQDLKNLQGLKYEFKKFCIQEILYIIETFTVCFPNKIMLALDVFEYLQKYSTRVLVKIITSY